MTRKKAPKRKSTKRERARSIASRPRDEDFKIPKPRIPAGWRVEWASGVYIPDTETPTEPIAMFEYRDQACAFAYHQMPQAEVRLLATGERILVSAMHHRWD